MRDSVLYYGRMQLYLWCPRRHACFTHLSSAFVKYIYKDQYLRMIYSPLFFLFSLLLHYQDSYCSLGPRRTDHGFPKGIYTPT
jgi:hypothetical protein